MGYDIGVRFKTVEKRDLMLSFFETEKTFLEEMSHTDTHYEFSSPIKKGENLNYSLQTSLKNKIAGFHGSFIGYNLWAICAWMAVQSEYRKDNQPIIYYDDEALKVSINGNVPKGFDVDNRGILTRTNDNGSKLDKLLSFGVDFNAQKELLNGLHLRWLKFLEHNSTQNHKIKNNKL